MTSIRATLDERKSEFKAYARLLGHLETRLTPRASQRRTGDLPTAETFKAMKATAFLMLYNIIEATIVGAMTELYTTIEHRSRKFGDVTDKIQDLWIDQRFWIVPHEATPATYRKRAAQMLREAMAGTTLALDPKRLPLSGNIDARVVRDLCDKHGWELKVDRRAKGGVELGTVKTQRNALAHGEKSFVECGQSYAVSDIARIAAECFRFLGGFIRSVERFESKSAFGRNSAIKPSSSP